MKKFITLIKKDSSIDLKALGLKDIKFEEMLSVLKTIYGMPSE